MKLALPAEALASKFREINSLIDPAEREAAVAGMPPPVRGIYDSFNSSSALSDLYTNVLPTADEAVKATLNGFTKATIGTEFFETPRKMARETVMGMPAPLEGAPSPTLNMLQSTLPKLTPDDVYETMGNLAGVVSSVMLGGVAGLSGKGLATAVAGLPIAGGTVSRGVAGQSAGQNIEQTAMETGGVLAGFGTFGLGKILGEKVTGYALGKAVDPVKGFVGRTFGKMLGAIDQQLVGETIAKGGAYGGAAALLSLGYATGDTTGAMKMLPMVLLTTPNPVSKSLLDSLILAKAKRLETADPAELATSDKFFQLMNKWEQRFTTTQDSLQRNPEMYRDFMQFYKTNEGMTGIKELYSDPKKLLPGISETDAASLRNIMGELVDSNVVNTMVKSLGGQSPLMGRGGPLSGITFPKSPQQVMEAAQDIKNNLVRSAEVVQAMRGPATKYAGEGYKQGELKQAKFDTESFLARRRQAQADVEAEQLIELYGKKDVPVGNLPSRPSTQYANESYQQNIVKQPKFDMEGFLARRRQAQAEQEMDKLLPLYEGKPKGTTSKPSRRTAGAYKGSVE